MRTSYVAPGPSAINARPPTVSSTSGCSRGRHARIAAAPKRNGPSRQTRPGDPEYRKHPGQDQPGPDGASPFSSAVCQRLPR